jgi:hypothetical protein
MMKNLFAQHLLWHMIFSITKDFVLQQSHLRWKVWNPYVILD